ncbi:MAG: cobalamin-dependent protein, partial [Phycisphaerales bacterium]|nr:cobalamin-dependent protein [Phycisphaerales bacterium]
MLDPSTRQLSLAIDSVAGAVAPWTVDRHAEVDPDVTRRFGETWRPQWLGDVRMRLRYLAQAVAVRRPVIFADAVTWSAAAFVARDVPLDHLRHSMQCLRDVLMTELPSAAGDILAPHLDAGLAAVDTPCTISGETIDPDHPHGRLVLAYLEAGLSGRAADAERLLIDAADRGMPIADLYHDVLTPAQREIGRMWHADEVSIAEEHLITSLTETVLARLRAYFPDTSPNDRRAVATTVGGELHAVGMRMIADTFLMSGWNVLYLGANVPTHDLLSILVEPAPDLLAISVTNPLHVRELGDLIAAVRGQPAITDLPILIGGSVCNRIPDLWTEVGAD